MNRRQKSFSSNLFRGTCIPTTRETVSRKEKVMSQPSDTSAYFKRTYV
jgi:hypothetical protein